ncbi:adenylyl-sulfate kinase CysC [Janthinobacterium sp. HH01]|uniref:adenylyl-sulfate kinase n=3 Tax=Oxalobacteraceae TaxID=75682 RepID=UPI0002AE7EC5|nr:adenylyl-sulfate kinase [Janthinobacterium sp. HH01]ELX09450.1 adenylyl-sulfate kinase CysC [Janthinobacterium sp. HH01]
MGKMDKLDSPVLTGAPHIFWHGSQVTAEARNRQAGQQAATLWLTGLSGAGKSTLACALEDRLVASGHPAYVLDGDNLRHHLNSDLGFSPADRQENIRRSAEVARLMNDAGLFVICAFISPLRQDREMARRLIGADNFIEVHVSTSRKLCEARDPKGLYKKARAGLIPEFTGITAPYEAPLAPALSLDTGALSLNSACELLYQQLSRRFV